MFYNNSPPEVPKIGASQCAPSPHIPRPAFRYYLVFTVLIIAEAVGIGVAIVHLASSYSPPATTSSRNLTSAAQYILDDTSLAALIIPNGDRHLFFQDNNGSIRHAIRTGSDKQWTISPYLNLSANPKTHTPLAATVYNEAEAFWNGVVDASLITVNI